MKLVPGWKRCLTWYSQWANLAMASIAPTWVMLPDEWRDAIIAHPVYLASFAATIGVLGFIGRIIDQGSKDAS